MRTADEVVPRLDGLPSAGPKPPSGVWSAATYAAVCLKSADDSPLAAGPTTTTKARPRAHRLMATLRIIQGVAIPRGPDRQPAAPAPPSAPVCQPPPAGATSWLDGSENPS